MTFFVSDALKDRVTEASLLDDVYHEEQDADLYASLYDHEGLIETLVVESVEKSDGKLDIKINVGNNIKAIARFLNADVLDRFEITSKDNKTSIITLKNPNIELVKIKKVNKRNSYFARIVIV